MSTATPGQGCAARRETNSRRWLARLVRRSGYHFDFRSFILSATHFRSRKHKSMFRYTMRRVHSAGYLTLITRE